MLLFLASLAALLLVDTRVAWAATLSNNNSTTACPSHDASKGDYQLTPPQHNDADGFDYYCVTGLTAGEITRVDSKLNCPKGIGRGSGGFGPFCLGNLINPTYETPPPVQTGDHFPGSNAPFCGDPAKAVRLSIDLGCKHKGNPIMDALFAIIRFLTYGVGLIIIGSTIVAGIQYSASRGDPNATAAAIARVRNNLIALLIFIFAFPIINYLIPNGLLK